MKTAPSRELKRSNSSIHFFLISNGTWTQEPSGQGKRSSQIRVRRRRPGQRNAIYVVLGVASEKAMAPHSSTLAWKIPWTEEPGRLWSWGCKESDMTERLHFHFSLLCTGEGNGNPLQCSCLENPRDGGAWWAAVYGVAQSQTWLKRLRSISSSSRGCMGRNDSTDPGKDNGSLKFFRQIRHHTF